MSDQIQTTAVPLEDPQAPGPSPEPPGMPHGLPSLLERIESDFTYHAPKGDQTERYQLIRNTAKKLARILVENVPPGRELSSALTRLEEAVFHANAGIARNE